MGWRLAETARWALLLAPAGVALTSIGWPRQGEVLQTCLILAAVLTLAAADDPIKIGGRLVWSLATALFGARLAFFEVSIFPGLGATLILVVLVQAVGLGLMAKPVQRRLGLGLGLIGTFGFGVLAVAPELVEGSPLRLACLMAGDLLGPPLALWAGGASLVRR